MGGSKIAVGSTHIVMKSLVRPALEVYAIRGVDAVEIIPQHISRRNLAMSSRRQSVFAAAIATTPRVPTVGAATYQRNSGGRRHHADSVTTARHVRRLVSDVAFIFHRSACDTCYCLLVAADRKILAAYSSHKP